MSNLPSESEVLDLEKGKGSDPKTESTSAAQNKDTELVTDPRKARLINFVLDFVLAVLCVAAIVVFVYSVYSMYNGTVSLWEGFGYCAVFVVSAVSIGTVLVVRKALISKFAAARPAAATTAARPPPSPAAARPRLATAAAARTRPAATTTAARPVATASAARARPDEDNTDDDDDIDPLEVLFLL